MRVLAHPDPFVLEKDLLDRVAGAQEADPLAAVLVIVPTTRLAAHVRRRLAEGRGACLNVHVLQYRALAARILENVGKGPPRVASPRLREALVARVLRDLPDNPWSRYAARRPGALGGILGALDDLREAGIDPGTAAAVLDRSDRERALARIHASYVERLEHAAANGLTDEAGFIASCLGDAAAHARRYRAIVHHGAYDLIGVHLDLLRALDRVVPVDFLIPVEPGSRATVFAEDFARSQLLDRDEDPVRLGDRTGGLVGCNLAALFDEERRPEPVPGDRFRCRTVQGSSAEVATAFRQSLAALGGDTSASEIAIVARSLDPFGIEIEDTVAADPRLPWTSSLRTPLRRSPIVRDLLSLLRVVADDFPRGLTSEVLASRWIDWDALLPDDPRPPGDSAETLGRAAGLVGGFEEWTELLPSAVSSVNLPEDIPEERRARHEERARRDGEKAARIARAIQAIDEAVRDTSSRSWPDHADRVTRLVRKFLPGANTDPQEPAVAAMLEIVEEMRLLPLVTGEEAEVPFATMVQWLERAVDGCRLEHRSQDDGGIRILDAMQARFMTFRHLSLVGFHSGLFPRNPREDPFLPDRVREGLRQASGRPIPIKKDGESEERLLLVLMLGAVSDRLEISWQRADETGRARSASLALREVARVLRGAPDLKALVDSADRVPSHPTLALEHLSPEGLSPDEALLLTALYCGERSDQAGPILELRPDLAGPLAMLEATESFSPADLRFDGRVTPLEETGPVSVTDLESLGRCPLQFFFKHRLRVRELDPDVDAFEIAPGDVGTQVHSLLEGLYRELRDEGLFETRGRKLPERALALLDDHFSRAMVATKRRLSRRFPVLWQIERERWHSAVRRFLEHDLSRFVSNEWELEDLESFRSGWLDLGNGIRIEVSGRFDRVVRTTAGSVIGDYKTRGDLRRRVNPTKMLKAETLQVPLYYRLAGGEGAVELLGVGPTFDPDGKADDCVAAFHGFDSKQDRGFSETMRVLADLSRAGTFAMNPNRHCSWCPYASACRRNHPPSVDRGGFAGDAERFRQLSGKSTRAPISGARR